MRASGQPKETKSAHPAPPDLYALVEGFPSPRIGALRFMRAVLVLGAVSLIWQQADLKRAVGAFLQTSSSFVLNDVLPPQRITMSVPSEENPKIKVEKEYRVHSEINVAAQSPRNFSVLLAIVFQSALAVRPVLRSILKALLGSALMGGFMVVQVVSIAMISVAHLIRTGEATLDPDIERIVLFPVDYFAAPAAMLFVAHLIVSYAPCMSFSRLADRLKRKPPQEAAVPQMVRRKRVRPNDPCPCGSGKKFKRCCGGTGGGSRR